MTSPFDLKLYVKDGKLKYVIYDKTKHEYGNAKHEYDGSIHDIKFEKDEFKKDEFKKDEFKEESKEDYKYRNRGDLSSLKIKLITDKEGRQQWTTPHDYEKFTIDGIYLDDENLGILKTVRDGYNKVNIYRNSSGKKEWVVVDNPEQERKQKEQEQKDKANASEVEFLVNDKDRLIIWKHKGDECKLYKEIPIKDGINCEKMRDTFLYPRHDTLDASGGDVPVDTTRKIMEKIATGSPNLVYLFREERILYWIVYYDKHKMPTSVIAQRWIEAFKEKHKKAEELLNKFVVHTVDSNKRDNPEFGCSVMFKSKNQRKSQRKCQKSKGKSKGKRKSK